MKNRLRSAFVLACFLLVVTAPAAVGQTFLAATVADKNVCATLSAAQKLAAEALIRDFSSKEWTFANDRSGLRLAVRQKAVERLVEIGPDVLPFVHKTLAETTDAEVKYRGELVLKGLMEKYGINVESPEKPVPGKVNFGASTITIDAEASAADILAMFAKQSGNALAALPANWPAEKMKFSVREKPYWQALDEFCRASKLTCDVDPKAGGFLLRPPTPGVAEIAACAGPVKVCLAASDSHRFFSEPGASVSCQLVYFYEDRLSVTTSDAWLTRVVTADGKTLEIEEKKPGLESFITFSPAQTASGQARVRLVNVPEKTVGPLQVIGVVRLDVGVGEKTINLGNVLKDEQKAAIRDGLSLAVSKVDVGDRYVCVGLSASKDAGPASLPYGMQSGRFGFFLVDKNGKRYPGGTFPGHFKLKPHHLEALLKDRQPINMSFAGKQGEGQYNVYFLDVPGNEPVLTLIYVYPATVVSKEYPFKLDNVPLP